MAVAVGKFDALHLGHRALAERAAELGVPVLLGFDGMPAALGWARRDPLVAPRDRARVLAGWCPAPVGERLLPFAEVRSLGPAGFLRLLASRLGAVAMVVGDDFRGGPGRSSTVADFAAAGRMTGVSVAVVPHLSRDGMPISSTRVRALVDGGEVDSAARLLGRPHRLCGEVVLGDRRGREIGFPTANLGLRANLAPGSGVYAAWAWLGRDRLPAAVNIGVLPTIGGGRRLSVEAHLIGWSGDCYGAALDLDFVVRLRDECRFPSLDGLKAQIAADVVAALAALQDT